MSPSVDIKACADHITSLQRSDGTIPWIEAGVWDAWNHGEATMGLAIAGREAETLKALTALMDRQEGDGGWTGDLLIVDWEQVDCAGNVCEIYIRRFKSSEVTVTKVGDSIPA